MIKPNKLLYTLAVAAIVVGCEQDYEPVVPDTPTAGYRFTFDGSAGDDNTTRASWTDNNDGKLTFAWDYTDEDNPRYEMVMGFLTPEGNDFLQTIDGSKYSDVIIKPHSKDDEHWATFETVKWYDPIMPDSDYDGYTVLALHGKAIELPDGSFSNVHMLMPNEFTQREDPTNHLKDFMYMYADATIQNGSATLDFRHLTVPVRFRVYNWRTEASTIYNVIMKEANGGAISRSRIDFTVSESSKSLIPVYPQAEFHNYVKVKGVKNNVEGFSINPKGENGDILTFYAHLLPLGEEDGTLEGKTLVFTLEVNDPSGEGRKTYLTYELPAETFYQATQSYNWQAGDLYTFHLYLDDVLTVGKVTVNDWDKEEIDGGEAEEDI